MNWDTSEIKVTDAEQVNTALSDQQQKRTFSVMFSTVKFQNKTVQLKDHLLAPFEPPPPPPNPLPTRLSAVAIY